MARRHDRGRYDTFISLRIPSQNIHAKVKEVQDAMSAKDGRLRSFHEPTEKNHITVILLRPLNNDSELRQ